MVGAVLPIFIDCWKNALLEKVAWLLRREIADTFELMFPNRIPWELESVYIIKSCCCVSENTCVFEKATSKYAVISVILVI